MSEYQFFYDNRAAGTGKTTDQIRRLITYPGRYVYAVDRRNLVSERRQNIEQLAAAFDVRIQVVEIYSISVERTGGVRNVRVAIEALPHTYQSGHVIALVTHQGLKDSALDDFGDWDLVIDEAPSLWDQHRLQTGISHKLVADLFSIAPGAVANRITPRSKVTPKAMQDDCLAAGLSTLQCRLRNSATEVFTFVDDWDELAINPGWTWYSLWSVRSLRAFRTVTVLSADFDRSLTIDLCRATAPDISWVPLAIERACRPFRSRDITICYFAEEHQASRHRFDSADGKAAMAKVAAYLARQSRETIWTCNSKERPVLAQYAQGVYLTPCQAGTNSWSHMDRAVVVYTAKPDNNERTLLKSLGVDPQLVIDNREHDVIYQFCARTSLRDPDSNRPVTLTVYDRVQAEVLHRALSRQSEFNVQLELVDLGFAHERLKREDLSSLTPEQRAARKREQAKLRKRNQRERDRNESNF